MSNPLIREVERHLAELSAYDVANHRGKYARLRDKSIATLTRCRDALAAPLAAEPTATREPNTVAAAMKRIAARRREDEADIRIIVGDQMKCVTGSGEW